MITLYIDFPVLKSLPVALVGDSGTTRAGGGPPALTDVVTLGVPLVQEVTEETVKADDALVEFVRAGDPRWRFHLVHLGCSFRPADGVRIARAEVGVRLKAPDATADQPIVWSLTPQRAERPVEVTRGVTLGAKLAFVEATVESNSQGTGAEVFIESFGLLESACSWEFRRSDREEIRGTQRLALVVRAPRAENTVGQLTVKATITYRRWRMFPFRAVLPDGQPLSFELPV
ncbi:hypothetical protein AB0M02_32375 [Actinoplanes sp. NPDC051861]|uniref:hypothetical protein n=1 Tax=Actinoplanes sp. NPDC051861 TaxID=3155170 RepID=UPI0034494CAD